MGETHGASVYEHGELRKLNQISARDSIGILYSLVTLHIGFNFNSDEYKIVWLAAYGDPEQFRDFFECAVTLKPDGTIRVPLLPVNRSRAGARTIL